MDNDWITTYRTYTDAELAEERTKLKTWADTPFVAQTHGTKSFQRSSAEIRSRLAALSTVQQERSASTTAGGDAVADFSQVGS